MTIQDLGWIGIDGIPAANSPVRTYIGGRSPDGCWFESNRGSKKRRARPRRTRPLSFPPLHFPSGPIWEPSYPRCAASSTLSSQAFSASRIAAAFSSAKSLITGARSMIDRS